MTASTVRSWKGPLSARERSKRAFESWVLTHVSAECRALGHSIEQTTYAIPGHSAFLLCLRYCARGCGKSEKRVIDADTGDVLSTFDRQYGDDYLKPAAAQRFYPGAIPRSFWLHRLPTNTDPSREIVDAFERWNERGS